MRTDIAGKSSIQSGTKRIRQIISKHGIKLVLLLLIAGCSLLTPNFFTLKNALNIGRQTTPIALIAFAEGILLVNGRTDLAAGSTMCFAGLVGLSVSVATENIFLALLTSIIVAVICSLFSSLFIAFLGLHHYIVTLAMQMAIRGIAFIYTGGLIITQTGTNFKKLGQGYILGIPIPIIILAVVFIFFAVLLSRMRLGRNFYAIGGNIEAARATGINIERHTMAAYAISGIFIGIAGFIFTSRVNAGAPAAGVGIEGQGIASAVVGGVSFSGGVGTAGGVLVGAFIMGIISNILNLMAVDSYIQQVVNAALILLAVTIDEVTKRKKLGE